MEGGKNGLNVDLPFTFTNTTRVMLNKRVWTKETNLNFAYLLKVSAVNWSNNTAVVKVSNYNLTINH